MQDRPMPWAVHELADYATHDLTVIGMIVTRAPQQIRGDLVHVGETIRRLALFLDALADEPDECTMRVAARAQAYEERASRDAEGLAGIDSADILRALFREHRQRRSPGEARGRGVGFERRGEPYGGG